MESTEPDQDGEHGSAIASDSTTGSTKETLSTRVADCHVKESEKSEISDEERGGSDKDNTEWKTTTGSEREGEQSLDVVGNSEQKSGAVDAKEIGVEQLVQDDEVLEAERLEEDEEEEEDGDSDEEEEDGGGRWITPSNLKQVKKAMGDKNSEPARVTVGCLTTDFAMQVSIKMG